MLGTFLGSLIGGWISTRWGRRRPMFYSGLLVSGVWLQMAFSAEAWMIYVSRLLMGLAAAPAFITVGVYISETAHKSARNALGPLTMASVSLGFLITYAVGLGLGSDWRRTAVAMAALPLMASLAMHILPETPYWLVQKGRYSEARLESP